MRFLAAWTSSSKGPGANGSRHGKTLQFRSVDLRSCGKGGTAAISPVQLSRNQSGHLVLNRLYQLVLSLARSPHALWVLAAVSFAESSVFPIPPDVLLIPMVIASPKRAFLYAGTCTVASVAGGAFGYLIGAQLFHAVGRPILDFYGQMPRFDEFRDQFNAYGGLAVLVAGVTPFPYKVITITSGATGLPLTAFLLWSITARALRFFVVAGLLWKFGEPIRSFIERRLGLLFGLFAILLVAGFLVAAGL